MPNGDCTGPRWKRGRGRGQRGGYNDYAYPSSNSFFGRIGGMFTGRRGKGWGMQKNYSQNDFYGNGVGYGRGRGNYSDGRGQGRGKGRKGKGQGRGGRW